MAVLRHVPKTFSFEEQRIEINEIAQDLYDLNVTASGIALTDISVVKPNPTASGSGDVTYDSSNGQFTYTPPELNFLTDLGDAIVDGDFTTAGLMKTDGAGNYSVITDNSTDWDEAHGWGDHANAGYLTGLPAHSHSLVSLSDTSLTGGDAPSDGEALVWDQTNTTWKAGTISSGWQGNVQNSTTANGGGAISFDANTNTLIFQPTEFNYDGTGVAQGKTLRYNGTKWVISQDVSYSQAILGDFSSVQWDLTPTIDGGAGLADSITITAGDNITFSSVTGSGFTIDAEDAVHNINDLDDVDTTGAVNGKILKHNGTKFVIADDASGSTITSLNDIGDVNVGTTITDGHVLKWDLATTKWIAGPDLTSSGGSGIALTDISVVKPNPAASGSGDVTYNSTSGQFTYTPPSIPAAPVNSDWDSTTGLSEILNKPTIVENLNDLGDVDTTGAANGKILKHNGTSWEIADDLTSGGGSATFTGLSDTPNSLSAGKWLKVNTGGTALEWTDEPTSGAVYTIEALLSPGIQLLDDGNAGASNRIFFDAGDGITVTRTNTSPHTIEFAGTTFTGTSVGLVPASTSGVTDKFLRSDGAWADPPTGGSSVDLTPYVKKTEAASLTLARTGANNYIIVNTESYFDLNTSAQCTLDVGAQFAVDAVGQIQLHSDSYVETQSTRVDFKNAAGNSTYAQINSSGLNLYTGGIYDKDGQLGTAGQILSSTGTSLDWIDATGEANVQADWTQTTTTAADYIKNKPGAFGGTASGLVPASTSGETSKFLRSDGTWQDASSGATTIDGLTDTNLNTSNLGSGQVLQHDGSKWVNADAPSGVPSGTIVMYNSGSAPTGWAVCDGNNGTPDLRGRFIVASGGNISGTGGSADAVLIQHSHEYNFTSSGSAAGAHSHTAGNYATNNTGSHSHNQSGSGSGSGTTGNQSANHYHTTSTTVNTGSDGSHQHRWGTDDLIGAQGGNTNPDGSGGTDWRAWTDSQGAHSHTFNFTHDTLGVSENHTHDFNFNYNIGGSTGNDGSHSHNVNGNTNNTGAHGHSFNLGDVSGQHSSVTVSSGNAPGTNKNLPPYYTLTYIMKL